MSEKKEDAGFVSSFIMAKKFFDGWSNFLTGLNTKTKDARTAAQVRWNKMSEVEIENLWAGDAIATKIVELPVDEALQKGYKLTGITPDEEKNVLARAKQLHFDNCNVDAAKKARGYGGAAILKVYNDDLKLDTPAPVGVPLKSLVVFQRFEIPAYWEDVQKDLLNTEFGTPVYYTFVGRNGLETSFTNIKIHYSRLVIYDGSWLPDALRQSNSYWGDTVLSKVYDAVRNYSQAHEGVNSALKDLSVAIFKIKNLADQVASDCDDKILKRLEIVNLSKSIARAVILDAEGEDFDYKTRNLTGAKDLVDKAEDRLAAESNIPKTVLLGTSPQGGGLANSGDHSSDNWHAWLESYQNNKLKDNMLEIFRAICDELKINHANLDIEFTPLSQMSEKELVEMRNKQADTDQKYIDMGVYDATEVRKNRFAGDKYSIETQVEEIEEVGSDLPPDVVAEMQKQTGVAGDKSLQQQALNGAQVTSLIEIVTQFKQQILDRPQAKALISSAFPTMNLADIEQILGTEQNLPTPTETQDPKQNENNGGFNNGKN